MSALASLDAVRAAVHAVPDPELPHVTIGDLGMVRSVTVADGGAVVVTVTPTYTACPATEVICADIVTAVGALGVVDVQVAIALAPAWSSDDITEVGRARLAAAGIAPPGAATGAVDLPPPCPRCGSRRTELVSWFGATACKSAHRCRVCAEPFEAFKAI